MDEIHKALVKQFGKKKAKAAELNWGACQGRLRIRRQDLHQDRSLPRRAHERRPPARSSSTATPPARWAAMFAGVTVVTWYPITPSSSLVETLIGYMRRFRHDPETGKATYAIVQAEDELASIGMALGAGWAGARSMTATAGPGISLMSRVHRPRLLRRDSRPWSSTCERVGPSTGLPTRTAQGDLLTTALLSHGDTKHPMFFPCSPEECFSHVDRGVRLRRAVPDAGLRHDRSRSGHEQLDGRPVRRIPRSRSSAARC